MANKGHRSVLHFTSFLVECTEVFIAADPVKPPEGSNGERERSTATDCILTVFLAFLLAVDSSCHYLTSLLTSLAEYLPHLIHFDFTLRQAGKILSHSSALEHWIVVPPHRSQLCHDIYEPCCLTDTFTMHVPRYDIGGRYDQFPIQVPPFTDSFSCL